MGAEWIHVEASMLVAVASLLFTSPAPVWQSGISAPDVAPLVHGVVAESVQTLVFAGCFLALDDGPTCIQIAGRARDGVTAP